MKNVIEFMYRFNKKTKHVTAHCKECKKELSFEVPENLLDGKQDFPVAFRYVHGNPIHSLTLYFDRSFKIRGLEAGDSLTLSNEIIKKYVDSCTENEDIDAAMFLRTTVNALTTVLNLYPEIRDDILFKVGMILGESYAPTFTADTEIELLENLGLFWDKNNLGTFKDIERKGNIIHFNVKDCFECSFYPNIGKTVCSMDQGFITGILEKKFESNYRVEEIECYATGFDHCRFNVEKID